MTTDSYVCTIHYMIYKIHNYNGVTILVIQLAVYINCVIKCFKRL